MPRFNLQPIPRFVLLALGFHVLLGAGLWWWIHRADESGPESPGRSLTWISPADFQPSRPLAAPAVQMTDSDSKSMLAVVGVPKTLPPPPPEPVPKAIAIDPEKAQQLMRTQQVPASQPLPPMDGSRFITVSQRDATSANGPAGMTDTAALPSGTDAAGAGKSLRLDEVDRAIIDAFRRNWTPPNASTLSIDQRTAHMDVTVDRTGRVLNFKLAKRSGNDNFDLSVLDAANRLDKIEATLPDSYPRDHYEFQVHFHVE